MKRNSGKQFSMYDIMPSIPFNAHVLVHAATPKNIINGFLLVGVSISLLDEYSPAVIIQIFSSNCDGDATYNETPSSKINAERSE